MKADEVHEKPRYCMPLLSVDLIEAKPNKLFSEDQRALVRFLRYYEMGKPVKVACAHCGKKKSILWTQLCSFRIAEPAMFTFKKSEKLHPPLTPVCQTHTMAPEMQEVDEVGNRVHSPEEAR
jgi:hypothetical protein